MKQIQPAYRSKLAIAETLAALGARAVTISAVAKTVPADSRDIYKQINNALSPSGQTPKDHQWFLANRTRRLHGAALLLLYCTYRSGYQSMAPHDAHGLAFAMSLMTYRELNQVPPNGEPLVSPERFSLLVTNGYQFGWESIIRGAASNFVSDNVKVMKCRSCRTPHLTEAHYVKYECSACVEAKEARSA